MKELIDLGYIYISDFIKEGESPRGDKHSLKIILDENINAPRLETPAPYDQMFGKYWYRSGINQTMKNELSEIVESVFKIKEINEGDLWVDIASNDGTLLSFLPKKLIRIGIDPAEDSFAKEAKKHSDLIIQDYFSSSVFKKSIYGKKRANVITCIAMFYDAQDPIDFLQNVKDILDPNGIFILQMSYTPLMITQLAFDNICHEHVWYYSLSNIKELLEKCGFSVFNVELNDVNGGSFRVYCRLKDGDLSKIGTQQYRDVSEFRVNSIIEFENKLKINDVNTWENFYEKIITLKQKTVEFITKEKNNGKKIWAYGASTKGNTLLQFFNLDYTLIDGIADRNPDKWGTKTVGTNIPIYSEEFMRESKPDYLLILPWHFINEFSKREQNFLKNGGKFIVPCPKFEII
jgi:SAM-dependent methyltransferase